MIAGPLSACLIDSNAERWAHEHGQLLEVLRIWHCPARSAARDRNRAGLMVALAALPPHVVEQSLGMVLPLESLLRDRMGI